MPIGPLNLEYENLNSQRRFPLSDNSSGVDSTGSFNLPNSFLLACDLPVHAGMDVDPARFFLQKLGVYANGFSIIIGYQPATGDAVPVATALIARASHTPGNTYALGGINDYADTVGKVVVGKLDEIDDQPAGLFEFIIGNARIEPDCVRPIIRGVSAIRVVNGTETSDPLYGDIELVADENMQLTPVIIDGQNPQVLISAIQGEGLSEACVCTGDTAAPSIKRINGIGPTADGNFTFKGNACLEVSAIQHGLKLADVCSEPCCGCKELEILTRQLEMFGAKAATLEGFINRLEAESSTTNSVILGSRLSDIGCNDCT